MQLAIGGNLLLKFLPRLQIHIAVAQLMVTPFLP
jgi:hypothetical protein